MTVLFKKTSLIRFCCLVFVLLLPISAFSEYVGCLQVTQPSPYSQIASSPDYFNKPACGGSWPGHPDIDNMGVTSGVGVTGCSARSDGCRWGYDQNCTAGKVVVGVRGSNVFGYLNAGFSMASPTGDCKWTCSDVTMDCNTCVGTSTSTVNTGVACSSASPSVTTVCGGKNIFDAGNGNWRCSLCTDGEIKVCPYTGPQGTENVGICKAGIQTCSNGQWDVCSGEVLPVAEICGDGVDNNCDGNVDEGCEKILESISGSGQEGEICKTLKEPFVVSANSKDVGINWQVTQTPSGSSGASISQSVTTIEGSDVFSSAYLKLGNLPGSYTTEARCSECTQGNPQTFTANAVCPEVQKYSQGGTSPWANDPYDNLCAVGINPKTKKKYGTKSCEKDAQGNILPTEIPYTIAGKGCALTSMAMVMKRYGSTATPDVWNKFLTQSDRSYNRNGDINWKAPTNIDLQLKRVFSAKSETPLSNSKMDAYLSKCMPVIVKVINPNTNSWHWVVVTEKTGTEYSINDPGYGARTVLSAYNNEIYAIQIYEKNNGGCQ